MDITEESKAPQKGLIADNLMRVQAIIKEAEDKSNRPGGSVNLIAVSKTQPVSLIMEAYNCGIRDFGENRVKELKEKIPALPKDIRWHMIGHLQRNKVKDIVGRVHMIHSVDSYELALQISRISTQRGVVSKILLEVNPAGEDSKTGLKSTEGITELVKNISKLPDISIEGLMTVPPITDDETALRGYFRLLRELSLEIKAHNIDNVHMDVLSMGMTGDYPIAISEGATHVRVGTGIFGQRKGY